MIAEIQLDYFSLYQFAWNRHLFLINTGDNLNFIVRLRKPAKQFDPIFSVLTKKFHGIEFLKKK